MSLRYSCTFDKSDLYWRQYLWIKLYDHFVQKLYKETQNYAWIVASQMPDLWNSVC